MNKLRKAASSIKSAGKKAAGKAAGVVTKKKNRPVDEGEADVGPEVKTTNRNRVIRTKSKKSDDEWLSELDKDFYTEGFDGTKYVLDATEPKDLMEIEEFRDARFQELHAVSRKFAGLVNANAEQFVEELTRVSELQDQLDYTTLLVKKERDHLRRADSVTIKALDVVRQNARKEKLLGIMEAVSEIKKLSTAQEVLSELLQKEAFGEAIALARESTEKLIEYSERGFTIVEDLATNLQDTTMQIEEHIDTSLSSLCINFNIEKYREIIAAYDLLGRPHAACDRLGSYFVTAIHVKTSEIMLKITLGGKANAPRRRRNSQTRGTANSAQFRKMCKRLTKEQFEPCLMGLCGAVCSLMLSFDQISKYHESRHPMEPESTSADTLAPETEDASPAKAGDSDPPTAAEGEPETAPTSPSFGIADALTDDVDPLESLMNTKSTGKKSKSNDAKAASHMSAKDYEVMKLELHRRRLWQDAQRQIAIFLHEVDLSHFPLPQYLQLLSHVRRLINIGESFSEFKSDILDNAIRTNALAYLRTFHWNILNELKASLNSDDWVSLDVVKDFNIFLLKEFVFLRQRQLKGLADESATNSTLAEYAKDPSLFQHNRAEIQDSDVKGILGGDTPNKMPSGGTSAAPPATASAAGSPSKGVNAPKTPSPPPPPHCSKTCMAVVRYFGRYLQIMDVLKPVAGEALQCLTEVYITYLDATWAYFTVGLTVYGTNILSPRARHALERMTHMKGPAKEGTTNPLFELNMEPPTLNENCALESEPSLYGLQWRITAMESLTFLATVLRSIKPNLVKRLPATTHKFLNDIYVQLVEVVPELRWYVYKGLTAKFIHLEGVVKLMSKVKWDTKEILSEHNGYVDALVKELNIIGQRIDALGTARLPEIAYNSTWMEIMEQVNRTFCEGFATAKKCTSEGRALMQLDYRQYQSKLAKVCTIKPKTTHVDDFIRAFYLQDEEIEEWIKGHSKQFTKKELSNVVTVSVVKMAKKERQRMLKMIEEL